MTTDEQLIHTFYTAFKKGDYLTMQRSYADNARFSDPVFKDLNASQVRAMWEMFLRTNKTLSVDFSGVRQQGDLITADWVAHYTLSSTGNPVSNHIKAEFSITDGKITRHTDHFNFYGWSRQALGLTGTLLGWTPYIKNKIRRTAHASLLRFIREHDKTGL